MDTRPYIYRIASVVVIMETKGETLVSSSSRKREMMNQKNADSFSLASKKKRRVRNLGRRTPFPLRVLILLGYVEIARRGLILLYNVNDLSWTSRAKDAISIYTLTYAVETLIAIFPGCK